METLLSIVASIALTFAGAIHSFDPLWHWWDQLVIAVPAMHDYIGIVAFILGIGNLLATLF